MQLFIILALIISIATVLFALQNSAIVTVSFLMFHFDGSLALILVLVFALGWLSGLLTFVPSLLRKGSQLREQKRKVRQLEQSISSNTASGPTAQNRSEKH